MPNDEEDGSILAYGTFLSSLIDIVKKHYLNVWSSVISLEPHANFLWNMFCINWLKTINASSYLERIETVKEF